MPFYTVPNENPITAPDVTKSSIASPRRKQAGLGVFVGRGESGGNYNAFNRGRAGDADRDINLTEMTVGEIQNLQSKKRGNPDRLFAVGKYQVIPNTLKLALKHSSVKATKDSKFTPELQEQIFNYLITVKRPEVGKYISGKSDNEEAALIALSKEWASLPHPKTFKSYYEGDKAGNKATGGRLKVEVLKGILNKMRNDF